MRLLAALTYIQLISDLANCKPDFDVWYTVWKVLKRRLRFRKFRPPIWFGVSVIIKNVKIFFSHRPRGSQGGPTDPFFLCVLVWQRAFKCKFKHQNRAYSSLDPKLVVYMWVPLTVSFVSITRRTTVPHDSSVNFVHYSWLTKLHKLQVSWKPNIPRYD